MSWMSDNLGGTVLDFFNSYATYEQAKNKTPSNSMNQWDSTSYLNRLNDLDRENQYLKGKMDNQSTKTTGMDKYMPFLIGGVVLVAVLFLVKK